MKTRNAVLTLAAVVMASVFAIAADPTPKMAVIKPNYSSIYKVIYQGEKAGEVTLQIKDSEGHVLLTQVIRGLEKFVRPLNFGSLDPGVYTVSVTDEAGTKSQQISYGLDSNSGKEELTSVFVSQLKDKGKYLFAVSTKTPEKVNVLIYDGNDNLVHTESREVSGNTAWVYKLKDVEGKPTFQVVDAKGFVKSIR